MQFAYYVKDLFSPTPWNIKIKKWLYPQKLYYYYYYYVQVKVMFGNGVRPQIWEEFTSRFNMPKIAEFYGATESNANISEWPFPL